MGFYCILKRQIIMTLLIMSIFLILGDHDPMFPYYYLPFSRGPRMCIGYRFAQMEMKVVLAHLVKNFTFKLAKSQSPDIGGRNFLTYRPCPVPLIEISRG